eukprot:1768425-Pyramimonas_sp.AAC.1
MCRLALVATAVLTVLGARPWLEKDSVVRQPRRRPEPRQIRRLRRVVSHSCRSVGGVLTTRASCSRLRLRQP